MALTPGRGPRVYLAQVSPWPGNEKIIERGRRGGEEKARVPYCGMKDERTPCDVHEQDRRDIFFSSSLFPLDDELHILNFHEGANI